MDYFRRPQLSGFNLQRVQFASIYGSVRRHDADGTSAVPYFPAVSATQTLSIRLDGATTYPVTLSGNTLSGIINDINAVLTSHGNAFDSDGCVGIETATAGGLGAVEVLGGTAAAELGFGPNGTGVRSTAGDLDSAQNGRIGNPFGTAFIGSGVSRENLTSDSVNRALGRIAANADVLYSEHVREDSVLQKVTGFTVAATGAYITLPITARVANGLGLLSRLTAPEDLAAFFKLIDPVTKKQMLSRVVGLVNGTPVGSPPYADSPNWADTTGKNILGLNLAKVSGVAITNILYGRYLIASGATFTTQVVAGDYLSISGATNTDQWNNNGLKWVVNAVLDDATLDIRPMSQSELGLVGTVVPDAQPVVELNSSKGSLEVYGNAAFFTGSYAQLNSAATPTLKVVVSPPIMTGAGVELWMAQPNPIRKEVSYDLLQSSDPYAKDMASGFYTLPNTLLAGISFGGAGDGSTITISGAIWRIYGKYVFTPGITVASSSLPGFTTGTPYYFYFDGATGQILSNASALPAGKAVVDDVGNPGYIAGQTDIIPLCIAQHGTPNTYTHLFKVEALGVRSITVGRSAQFEHLEEAAAFINAWAAQASETTGPTGNYPHWDIVLVSDVSLSSGKVLFTVPSVRITALVPRTRIICNSSDNTTPLIRLLECSSFAMEDVSITENGQNDGIFIQVDSAGATATDILMRNVEHDSTSSFGFQYIVKTINSGTVGRLLMEDCVFQFYRGLVAVNPQPTALVVFSHGMATQIAGYATPQLFSRQAGANWTTAFLTVEKSVFVNCSPTDSTPYAFLITTVGSKILFRGNIFGFGALTPGASCTLAVASGSTGFAPNFQISFLDNQVGQLSNPIHIGVQFGGTSPSLVQGNTFFLQPEDLASGGEIGVQCTKAVGNTIYLQPPDPAYTNQVAMQVSQLAMGNTILGTGGANIGINCPSAAVVSNNYIDVSVVTTSHALDIAGNVFVEVTGNRLISGSDAVLVSSVSAEASIVGNYLQSTNGGFAVNFPTPSTKQPVINGNNCLGGLAVTGAQVVGNNIVLNSGSTDLESCVVEGNYFTGNFAMLVNGGSVSGNSFTSSGVTLTVTGAVCVGNVFAVSTLHLGDDEFSGNNISGNISMAASKTHLEFNGNYVGGTFTILSTDGITKASLVSNRFVGAFACGVTAECEIGQSQFDSTVALTLTNGQVGYCLFNSNSVLGAFTSSGTSSTIQVNNCVFTSTVTGSNAFFYTSDSTYNQGLNLGGMAGPSLFGGGGIARIDGCYIVASAGQAGALILSGVSIVDGAGADAVVTGNYIAGVTNVPSAIFSTSALSGVGGNWVITGNRLMVDNGTSPVIHSAGGNDTNLLVCSNWIDKNTGGSWISSPNVVSGAVVAANMLTTLTALGTTTVTNPQAGGVAAFGAGAAVSI